MKINSTSLLDNNVSTESLLNLPPKSDEQPDSVLPDTRSETTIDQVTYSHPENVPNRTDSIPGAQYGVPFKDDGTGISRRIMTSNIVERYLDKEAELDEEEAYKRQKKQKGKAKRDSQKYYRKNKSKIKRKQKKYDRKSKNKTRRKRTKKRNINRNTTRRKASTQKVIRAFTSKEFIQQLVNNTNSKVVQNSLGVNVGRPTLKNSTNVYKVSDYIVQVQQEPQFGVKCSCLFFVYKGPEYWAVKQGYLLGSPSGTATKPKITDPKGNNKLCKHIVAVLQTITRNT